MPVYDSKTINIDIPEEAWEKDLTGGLLTHIRFNGLDMHLRAIRVKEHPQTPFNEQFSRMFDLYQEADEGYEFETTKIGKHRYVIFATPFCRWGG